jgi:hypothetical protein
MPIDIDMCKRAVSWSGDRHYGDLTIFHMLDNYNRLEQFTLRSLRRNSEHSSS